MSTCWPMPSSAWPAAERGAHRAVILVLDVVLRAGLRDLRGRCLVENRSDGCR